MDGVFEGKTSVQEFAILIQALRYIGVIQETV